jgi:dTDP-glucose 4,6-dehydratase
MEYKHKILVTGGYGFIGGNFIKFLREYFRTDALIVNVDKNGYASNPEYAIPYCNISHHIDIADASALESVFDESDPYDYIFHFAAESHVDNSISGPTVFVESNVLGTQNLLECYRNQNKGHGRFIHISTDEVYGHLGATDPAFTEETPLSPRSPYAASKASSDLMCLSYISTYGLDISITRCCNNFGPNQYREKLIPTVIDSLQEGVKIPVYGKGDNIREWIHVKEHNKAVMNVAAKGESGVYNIGSGVELTNMELVRLICKIMCKDPDENIEFVEDRLGHDFRYAIDCSKAKEIGIRQGSYANFLVELEEYIGYYIYNGR